jgi:LysM repeat protein
MPRNYLPDLRFLPENYDTITAATPLNDGVTVGSFLNGVTLDHIPDINDRKQLVRNLLPHAQILKSINSNNKRFADHKLVVVEGIYKQAPEEQLTESEDNNNFLALTGRGIVYELRRNKKTDNDKTFELARYLQVYHKTYDKIILDYDTYIEGELNAQIIIQTPEIPPSYNVNFKQIPTTVFNNTTQAIGQLVEITEIPETKVQFPADTPDDVTGYFTVGDLHARLVRVYGGDPWQSYARDGRLSRDQVILENLQKIRKGQVVVISSGYNDAVNSNDTPEAIANRVYKTVAISKDVLGHVSTFLLFPITDKIPVSRSVAVRNAIVSVLSPFNDVRIIDLNDSQYELGNDGKSLTPESYISISTSLI